CVREAVSGAERIVGAVTEVVDAGVVVRAGLRLAVALGEEAELVVVPPPRPGEIVLERVSIVLVPSRQRTVVAAGPEAIRALRGVITARAGGQVRARATAIGHVRQIRIFIDLHTAEMRVSGCSEWIQSRGIEAHARTIEGGIIFLVQPSCPNAEAPMVVR